MADGANQHRISPIEAGAVKKNSVIMLKGFPCKIMDVKTSKTGKHGHAKANITGICVVTGKKINEVQPSHATMYAADVRKTEYQLMDLTVAGADSELSCLDSNNEVRTFKFDPESEEGKSLLGSHPAPEGEDILVTIQNAPMQPSGDGGDVEIVEILTSHKTVKGQ